MTVSRRALLASTGAAVVASAAAPTVADATEKGAPATFTGAADYMVAKLRAVAPGVTGFPLGTKFEKWTFSSDGDWVGGFWPGLLWLAWLYSGDDEFRALAEKSALKLAPR